jgi:hypothetical protein
VPAARILGHLLAFVAGAVACVLGSFTFAYTDASVPVGLLVALSLSLAVFVTAGLAVGSRGAAAVAALGWLLPALLLSVQRPEGDLVVPATTLGYCWLLLGLAVAGISVAVPYADVRAGLDRPGSPGARSAAEPSGTARTGR